MSFDFIKNKVLVPSGKCPSLLKSNSLEDVKDWIKEINRFKRPDEEYQVSVYRYWAYREFTEEPYNLEEILENISIATNSRETIYSLAKNLG